MMTALVVGSSGALGSVIVRQLVQSLSDQNKCYIIGADVKKPSIHNPYIDTFIQLPSTLSLVELCTALTQGLDHALLLQQQVNDEVVDDTRNDDDDDEDEDSLDHNDNPTPKLNVIICAAGGWQGDADGGVQGIQTMLQVNLHPALAVANVIQPVEQPQPSSQSSYNTKYCAPGALCIFMGATAALQATPGMIGYGTAKAAVHHIVTTLAASSHPQTLGKKQKNNLLPPPHIAPYPIGILPTTLDTMANREAILLSSSSSDNNNATAVADTWVDCSDIANQIMEWIHTPSLRPAPGSLIKVSNNQQTGQAVFELVHC
jgi:NAD(P)-dependent dehydrogenase (short-subunit alcohol dehydrogenase family)